MVCTMECLSHELRVRDGDPLELGREVLGEDLEGVQLLAQLDGLAVEEDREDGLRRTRGEDRVDR